MSGFPSLVPFGAAVTSTPPTVRWPAFGVSHYLALGDPQCDPIAYADKLASVGAEMTRIWLCDPWACNTGETGCYDGFVPCRRASDGRWDLFDWNQAYFDRLKAFTAALWARGIWPQYTVLNLYQFSPRKQGLVWVPDMDRLPWRYNVNGVSWGHPDEDVTFFTLPDQWLREFMTRVVSTLGLSGAGYVIELANEMPEKEMHERMADHLRAVGYRGEITVNRNEDTPGQYHNMRIGPDGRYQRIAFHAQGDVSYLDEFFSREPVYQTFRELYDSDDIELSRVIWSGDGVGNNTLDGTYDEPQVTEVVADTASRGASVEWQAREWKLGRFLLGRFDVDDLYVDFTRQLHHAFLSHTPRE